MEVQETTCGRVSGHSRCHDHRASKVGTRAALDRMTAEAQQIGDRLISVRQ